MKVLNLQCAHGHAFEGWFASEDDFQSQQGRDLIECPLCGDIDITKGLSAPRLNLGARAPAASDDRAGGAPQAGTGSDVTRLAAASPELQAAYLQAVRNIMANTEDVGARFADEARRIHYGEVTERGIRGQATPEETRELVEEGIDVMPLLVPKGMKGSLQ